MFGFIQKLLKDFLMVFASIIVILTVLRQLYQPAVAFDLHSIYIIMGFSLLSAALGFISYSSRHVSERHARMRMLIHFLALEVLLIALAIVLDLVNSTAEGLILALQIAVIYGIIRLLSWRKDQKEARQINDKLQAFKKDQAI
ncbi:DUF3021 family protein [Ectobacillus ponti]|uniref:DUF3021 domain-containing protein n=1 Tax=Ectobacillus ponti TaxID=2961894 RepID=A0AA42BS64_9BACI|nr:DUF3021 family protein [Ectobacillus ponti]MCP8968113.1 DUF3021 domain-containing protein [Ectobacillus ponti]